MPNKAPKRIAVDFDGTLCDHAYPEIGAVKPGAKAALDIFKALGYEIIIWSCRSCHWDYDIYGGDPAQPVLERKQVKAMVDFLKANDIPFDHIDDGSKGKPSADFYIDDKAIPYQNNWDQIAFLIHRKETEDKIRAFEAMRAAQEQAATAQPQGSVSGAATSQSRQLKPVVLPVKG